MQGTKSRKHPGRKKKTRLQGMIMEPGRNAADADMHNRRYWIDRTYLHMNIP